MTTVTHQKQDLCPACGQGQLTAYAEKREVVHAGHAGCVESRYSVCDTCGSELTDAAQARANKRAMTAFRKRAEGLMTGDEIRAARTALGLTQGQAAKLFGGGKVGFSRYENDDVTQSEAMDSLIRLCAEYPDNAYRLARRKGVELASERAHLHAHFESLVSEHLSEIKQELESQIGQRQPAHGGADPTAKHMKVTDIRRWRKVAA